MVPAALPDCGTPEHCCFPSAQVEGWPLVLEAEAAGALRGRYPFLYARQGDLTIADVDSLLQQYKELALQHECLLRAVEGRGARA